MRYFHFPQIAVLFVLMGILSTALLVTFSGRKTELKSHAQSANVQVQCSPAGTVQFAISFTNPEAYPIDLFADVLLQMQTISRNYAGIVPGRTQTDIIRTNLTSLSNTGDIVFSWYQTGTMPENANDTTASFNSITCNPVTPSPIPTSTISGGEMDSSLLAITPLPPQPEKKPEPFYQAFFTEINTRIQTLIYNFSRFLSAFTT